MSAWRWQGEPILGSKEAAAEPRLAIIRAVVVTINVAAYPLLPRNGHEIAWLAEAVAVLALPYAYGMWLLRPQQRWPALGGAWGIAIADGISITLWLLATGGVHSPYYVLWYLSIVAVSFRFGLRETLMAALGYAGLYAGLVLFAGPAPGEWAVVGLRCAYLLLVGVAAGFHGQYSHHAHHVQEEMSGRMRAAQQAEARIRDLLGAVPDPILIVDSQGQIVLANEAAERAFGGGRGAPAFLDALAEGEARARLQAALERARSAPQTEEVRLPQRAGGQPIEVRLNRVETADGPRIVAVLRDLTDRKRAEEERLGHMERLKEFERLKELESFRTQFINAAAHELGTPLTPIRMQVHMLRRHADKLPQPQRRSLEILERNVVRLGGLVQEILDSARIQANRLGVDLKPTDVNGVVLEAVETFHDAAAQAKVGLSARLGTEMRTQADEKRLTQVLFNLIGNALKFTPAGGEIVVETRRQRGMVLVSIRDSGIGIGREDQKRLFQPFAQINAAGSPKVGAGLGLYISRGLIELHGGRLWCESPGVGQGTTFFFTIPTEEPERAAPPVPAKEESPLKRRLRDLV